MGLYMVLKRNTLTEAQEMFADPEQLWKCKLKLL